MIKAVFFDLDGTLVQSMFSHYLGWKKVLIKEDIKISKKDFYLKEGTKLQNLLHSFYKDNNKKYNTKKINNLIKEKNIFFLKHSRSNFYPGVLNLIKYLNKENYYICIVTAGSKIRVLRSLPKYFLEYFDKIITGDDCLRGKPYPDPYLKALKFSKFKSNQCIVYENAPLGILSAKRAKIKSVAVTNTLDKNSLNKANFIVNSATEFKKLLFKLNA